MAKSFGAFHEKGGDDIPVADGGTNASTAAAARTSLGISVYDQTTHDALDHDGLTGIPDSTTWTSWTPTGSWSTNVTYTGYYRVIGKTLEMRIHIAVSGTPDTASLTVNVPGGISVNTTALLATDGAAPLQSHVDLLDFGTARYKGLAMYSGGINIYYFSVSGSLLTLTGVTESAPFTFGSSDTVNVICSLPIT